MNKVIVTGGAGFIGSALIKELITNHNINILNIDALTYAGNLESLDSIKDNVNYNFLKIDISKRDEMKDIFNEFKPDSIMHLAAESHVDRSIHSPGTFIQTNIIGTYNLLEESREYFNSLEENKKKKFRFHHISTDEVYGDLEPDDNPFTEQNHYCPSSPYSASKASSDHLVRAWYRTYGLPILVTNCSNNYGPFHFPEKFVPHIILNALSGKPIPVYGDGLQIRDWLYVEDHARALTQVLLNGRVGETYNIGGHNEITNLELVQRICDLLEDLNPAKLNQGTKYSDLITFVKDRPGHDNRYAIDASKISTELGWEPEENLHSGLIKTVQWYLDNQSWWERVLSGDYKLERI